MLMLRYIEIAVLSAREAESPFASLGDRGYRAAGISRWELPLSPDRLVGRSRAYPEMLLSCYTQGTRFLCYDKEHVVHSAIITR